MIKLAKKKNDLRIGFSYGLGSYEYCHDAIVGILEGIPDIKPVFLAPAGPDNAEQWPYTYYNDLVDIHMAMKSMNVAAGAQILPINCMTACKTACKWLEWTVVGVPTLSPRFGEYYDELEDKETTLFFSDKKEFEDKVKMLKDKDLCEKLVKNSRELMFEKFTMEKIFDYDFIRKAKKIAFLGYTCPWRVFEPLKYFQSIGINAKHFVEPYMAEDFIDKDTVVILPRLNRASNIIRKYKKEKHCFIVYELDDFVFEKGILCFQPDITNFIEGNIDIIDVFLASTTRIQARLQDFIANKKPVLLRQMAIFPERYEGKIDLYDRF